MQTYASNGKIAGQSLLLPQYHEQEVSYLHVVFGVNVKGTVSPLSPGRHHTITLFLKISPTSMHLGVLIRYQEIS